MRGAPEHRRIISYDLEWWPDTLELRLVGVRDERGYRTYKTIRDFLAAELTHKNRAAVFWAHSGGRYDVQYVIAEIARACAGKFEVEALFSGSSAVLTRVRRGDHQWLFGDSYFVLRAGLAEVGDWIGRPKGDKAAITSCNESELRDYNEQDCEILYDALTQASDLLTSLGGTLRATLASSALDLFRRSYLTRPIDTKFAVQRAARRAYVASRVEVFRSHCERATTWDITSSFPRSMLEPQPGPLIGIDRTMPDDPDALFLAECTVLISQCDIPPIPFRAADSRIVFPVGRWRSWFDCADICLLQSQGHRVEAVHQVMHFSPIHDFGSYVEDMFARKSKASGFAREFFKLLVNALYGKLAEQSHKRKLLVHPRSTACPHGGQHADDSCMTMLAPGVWTRTDEVEVAHAHVPAATHVTALSRASITARLVASKDAYYTDCDSATLDDDESLPVSEIIGDMKIERRIASAEFLAPKLYAYIDRATGKPGVKAKGFSALSFDEFQDLANGGTITRTHMAAMGENARRGSLDVRMRETTKRILESRPKRVACGDGTTRPWHVDELRKSAGSRTWFSNVVDEAAE